MQSTMYLVMKIENGRYTVTGVTAKPTDTVAQVLQSAIEHEAEEIRAEAQESTEQSQTSVEPEAPLCAIHNIPMVQVQGKKGPFWSCHERVGDGWCTYRPPKKAA